MKKESGTCYIKYDFDEEFQELRMYGTERGRTAEAASVNVGGGGVPQKYKRKLPISATKKKDWMQMCKTGVIPPEFCNFHEKQPVSVLQTYLKSLMFSRMKVAMILKKTEF